MSFEGTRALVTGGAGFIGSHIVDELVKQKAEVIVIDNLSNGKLENLEHVRSKISFILGDVREPNSLKEIGKLDIIFHEAASTLLSSFASPVDDLEINAKGTLNMLELGRKSDARFIYASSGSVYGNSIILPIREDHPLCPTSPYGVSKMCGEHYVRLFNSIYHLETLTLRYFNVYGERQTISEEVGVIPIFVHRILMGKNLTIFGDGLQTRDFTHISDVVSANMLAARTKKGFGMTFNIGSGRETSIAELAQLVASLMGRENTPLVHKQAKLGNIRRLQSDVRLAEQILGFNPKTSLKTGLRKYIKSVALPSITMPNPREGLRIPKNKGSEKLYEETKTEPIQTLEKKSK